MMPLFCFSTLLAVRNIGLLHHLHWLLFLLALYFLFLSVILLYEMKRRDSTETRTMRIAREWRQRLLDSVYSFPLKPKNDETLSPRKPEFAARRTNLWERTWLKVSHAFRLLLRTIVGKWMKSGQNSTTIDHKGAVRIVGALVLTFASAALIYSAFPHPPVDKEHNVAILEQLPTGEWRMHSDEEGTFVYRPCPDFNNASVIWVGYIADYAQWRQYGWCRSIRATGLGFFYREGHNNWRRISDVRAPRQILADHH